jgi:dipeptidyl-peptidase-3
VKNGPKDFTLLVASANTTQPAAVHEIDAAGDKATLKVQYGDFSKDLAKVVEALKEVSVRWFLLFIINCVDITSFQAEKYTANDNQTKMIQSYIKS